MKLNLGCGLNKRQGFVNVDKWAQCDPDERVDLEVTPWPWATNSVEEVLFNHSLEHIGQVPSVFLGVMQELYRVCKPEARIQINAAHPRHDQFVGDPTLVRAITPTTLTMFCQRLNRSRQAEGTTQSPWGLYLDVDFELLRVEQVMDPAYEAQVTQQKWPREVVAQQVRQLHNVVMEYRMLMRVVKPEAMA